MYDYIIIAAGVAGITAALNLPPNKRIILLEWGNDSPEPRSDDDITGTRDCFSFDGPFYMGDRRLKMFGGTSNHWTGHCRHFDEEDFKNFPLDYQSYQDAFNRASTLIGHSGAITGTLDRLENSIFHESDTFTVKKCNIANDEARNFKNYRSSLENKSNITIAANTRVVGLNVEKDHRNLVSVTGVQAVTAEGRRNSILAQNIVMCMGGHEAVRLLKSHNQQNDIKIADGRPLGMYYNDHFNAAGFAFGLRPYDGRPTAPELSPEYIVGSGSSYYDITLNAKAKNLFSVRPRIWCTGSQETQDIPLVEQALNRGMQTSSFDKYIIDTFSISMAVPSIAENKYSIKDSVDSEGLHNLYLEYGFRPTDKIEIFNVINLFGLEYHEKTSGLLNLSESTWVSLQSDWTGSGGSHLCGGMTMHSDYTRSVVDHEFKVIGTNNLYCIGGELFPCSGDVWPTQNIATLAIMFSDIEKTKGI